jgi:pyridoxamine 5'-phosphate oxidase
MTTAELRRQLILANLDENTVPPDPFDQFERWFDEAVRAEMPLTNAMTLATVSASGQPAARIVLLKGVDHGGFVFYTNYKSRKGRELTANPAAALLFHWVEIERVVRIDGRVDKLTAQESSDYFNSRPLGSRHAAIASPQSSAVANRAVLEARVADSEKKYGEQPVRPAHWGGYRLIPHAIEFWQSRTNRLHDRVLYARNAKGWKISRLAP